MKYKFWLVFTLMVLSHFCSGQKLSFQIGPSTDIYFPVKSNSEYNGKPELYTDLLGLNVSYTLTLDTLKNRELSFFLDLYRFNFGTSVRLYPETENMDFTKLSTPGGLSPCLGLLYSIMLKKTNKFSFHALMGASLRFTVFSSSASGTFYNEGQNDVQYEIINKLNKTNPLSLSLNFAGQMRYKINKGTNLLFTPLISVGTFNWYEQEYIYEFRKNNEIIDQGVNVMKNNGSRLQVLIGLEFKL